MTKRFRHTTGRFAAFLASRSANTVATFDIFDGHAFPCAGRHISLHAATLSPIRRHAGDIDKLARARSFSAFRQSPAAAALATNASSLSPGAEGKGCLLAGHHYRQRIISRAVDSLPMRGRAIIFLLAMGWRTRRKP